MLKTTFLVRIYGGKIRGAIKFVDDQRTAFEIKNRRYAKVETSSGSIWNSDTVNFNSKDDGNRFYKDKLADGWIAGTEEQYNDFIKFMGNMTY